MVFRVVTMSNVESLGSVGSTSNVTTTARIIMAAATMTAATMTAATMTVATMAAATMAAAIMAAAGRRHDREGRIRTASARDRV